ncbi:EAL domain-containing protein [Sneathiella glossodoripedis]|uniref:EAL domain-containing protein n=1 Tax=Sneathiella glossodoripedis TaxID=418853 RepID=UPI0004721235|nr:EAL domain-containing protein [Sneathiella glossodoripedis]
MHRIEIQKGETVLSLDEEGNCAYIVESGSVQITDKVSSQGCYTVGPGEMFGEYGIIEEAHHYSTAVALEDTILVVVPQAEIEEKSASSDPLISLFLNFFMDRCHSLTVRHYGTDEQANIFQSRRTHRQNKIQSSKQEIVERFRIKEELEQALKNDEFVLHYQPIISLRGGYTAGFEALIRWQHPERGLLSPFHFIDIAEKTNMIVPIGEWVFKEACKKSALFNKRAADTNSPELFVSVNISANQFTVPDMVERFKNIAHETAVDVSKIQLEITESILMEDADSSKKMLQELKNFGFQLVLDDFGTGYSSLSYLHQFPIDKLKIDRSFTHDMLNDQDSLEIVRAISGLSHNMDIEIVAEGIETMEQLALYRDLDCHYGQGYLISKPLPEQELYDIIGTRMSFGRKKP